MLETGESESLLFPGTPGTEPSWARVTRGLCLWLAPRHPFIWVF